MIGGAIKAKVDELIAPTREMKRSNFGIAAARVTEKEEDICKFECFTIKTADGRGIGVKKYENLPRS